MISQKTAEQILAVLSRHVASQEVTIAIIRDLAKVEGNKSFRDSMQALLDIVENRA